MGRSATKSLATIWKSKDITSTTKLRLLKTAWSGQLQHMEVKDGLYTRMKRNIILKPSKCGSVDDY